MTEILAFALRGEEEQKEKTAMEVFASRELSDDSPYIANPQQIDHSLEISDEQFQQIFELMEKRAGKPLEDCTPLERAKALYEVIRTSGSRTGCSYGISYESLYKKE